MADLATLRARLAAATGPRCGRAYRYEFHDEGELIVSDGACDYPAGHTGDCGPMQPGEGAPTWEDVARSEEDARARIEEDVRRRGWQVEGSRKLGANSEGGDRG